MTEEKRILIIDDDEPQRQGRPVDLANATNCS